jgi:hypothetical protein
LFAGFGVWCAFFFAGELWTGVLVFVQSIRDLYELRFKNDTGSVEWLRYKNSVLKNPPGFKRKYAQDGIIVPPVDFTESRELCLATVLPHTIPQNGKSVIICKSWIPAELQIDLYSTDGKKIRNLYKGKIADGLFMTTWDGKDPAKKTRFRGNYKIRWTLGTGYREFPIVIK